MYQDSTFFKSIVYKLKIVSIFKFWIEKKQSIEATQNVYLPWYEGADGAESESRNSKSHFLILLQDHEPFLGHEEVGCCQESVERHQTDQLGAGDANFQLLRVFHHLT